MKSFFSQLPIDPAADPVMMGLHAGYNLAAPWSFWTASADLRRDVVNGCGPGGLGDLAVPDWILGLNMRPACEIHDWMFAVYNCKEGFTLSNNLFLNNMVRINHQHDGFLFLKRWRLKIIKKYFQAVDLLGESFYYEAHLDLV